MDLTTSQNPDSMVLASAKIELAKEGITIDNVGKTWDLTSPDDLGLARGIKISFSSTKLDVKADNGTVPLKGEIDKKAKVEFVLLERYVPLLGKIMKGLVTVRTLPGTKQKETEAFDAQKGKFYEFVFANYDGAKPENIVIKQGTKTLTVATDYKVSQNASGLWGFEFLTSGALDETKAVTVEYEVTRAKAFILGKGASGVVEPIALRLTNKRKAQDGRTIDRIFEFPYGFYDGEDSITLKSKNDTDPVAEVPISFEFLPHPELVLDEDLEKESLYRETAEI